MKKNNLFIAVISLFIATILSKLIGFTREAILVSVYGAGMISDVYITAMNIPLTLFDIVATALSTTFIPLFFKIQEKEGEIKALEFSNNIFNIVLIISLLLSIIGYIFAEPLVKIFAMEFSGTKLELAVQFTKIIVFSMVFIGLSKILSSWLQIKNNFFIPGIISIPYNIIIIISILVSYKYNNVKVLIVGSLLGIMSQFLFQLPYAYKLEYKYKRYINLKDKNLREAIYLVVPVFIGVGVSQLNSVIDKTLASTLGDGIITILNSASKLEGVISALFISTIGSVIYPKISTLYNKGLDRHFNSVINKSINTIILLIIPISIGIIVLANPLVSLIFERGKFDASATNLTSIALSFYCIGMIGGGVTTILNKVFYSLNDTKVPMISSIISIITNIVLNLISIRYLGYKGLALSTSISSIVCTILLLRFLIKKNIGFKLQKVIKTFMKSLIASIIMGFITYLSYKILNMNVDIRSIENPLILLTSIGIGAITYTIIILNMNIDEVNNILSSIRAKIS